jgi:CubicO group peptidase (beta-lactamase class C family)
MMHTRLILACVLALSAAGSCRRALDESPNTQIDVLFAEWNRPDSPGCGVGVSRDGTIVYERGYGMANLERRVPITAATVFDVASISKQFTAMSIMLLAEQGKLSLDDEVWKHIPEWQGCVTCSCSWSSHRRPRRARISTISC